MTGEMQFTESVKNSPSVSMTLIALSLSIAVTACQRSPPPPVSVVETIRTLPPAPAPLSTETSGPSSYTPLVQIELTIHEAYGEIRQKGLLALVRSIEDCYRRLDERPTEVELCAAMDYTGYHYNIRLHEDGAARVDFFNDAIFFDRLWRKYREHNHPQEQIKLSMASIRGMAAEIVDEALGIQLEPTSQLVPSTG